MLLLTLATDTVHKLIYSCIVNRVIPRASGHKVMTWMIDLLVWHGGGGIDDTEIFTGIVQHFRKYNHLLF